MKDPELLAMAIVLARSPEHPPATQTLHLDDSTRRDLLGQVVSTRTDPESTWNDLRQAVAGLDVDGRERVLSSAILAVMADADLDDEELRLLERFADQLDVPVPRVRELMREAFRAAKG